MRFWYVFERWKDCEYQGGDWQEVVEKIVPVLPTH